MTCHQAVSLMDDYLDGDLSPQQVAEIERHLASCPACSSELESGKKLRELLKISREGANLPEPRAEYWSESEAIILAKTTEHYLPGDETGSRTIDISTGSRQGTGSLVRSFMLFAASLALMISALYLGAQRQHSSLAINQQDSPILIAASLNDLVGSDHAVIVTKEEQNYLVRGMFALGAPGPVGRYTTIADLLGTY